MQGLGGDLMARYYLPDGRSGSRSGSRRRHRAVSGGERTVSDIISQLPWQLTEWTDAATEPLDSENLDRLHDASMRVLEEIGILFLNDEALSILDQAGCMVDHQSQCVRMDRDFVMQAISGAPSQFTITPRNPDRQIILGGRNMVFSSVASAPNSRDLDGGRRIGNREDFRNFLKLNQYFNCLHFLAGYPVEPVDLHASTRHLDALEDMVRLTDKVVHGYSLGPERIEDSMEIVRIASGLSETAFQSRPHMFTNINSSSPLKHDWPMLDGAMRACRRGQAVVVSPFTLAGAMAPVTVLGALVQQNAECLAALALLQTIRPGAEVVYGAFTSNVDMKTGAPAFGTPEYTRAMQISGQLARRYGLPWRGSNATAGAIPDGQAVWESAFSLQAIASGHCNMIYHGAGWLEGGLCASFEKLVMDCEMIQQWLYLQKPLDVSDDALAVEAIREVGPTSHFFGAAHTQARFKDAFYSPFLSDWRNVETWEEDGSKRVEQRANAIMKSIIADFDPPPLDQAISEELSAFVARRKQEGGAPTDF